MSRHLAALVLAAALGQGCDDTAPATHEPGGGGPGQGEARDSGQPEAVDAADPPDTGSDAAADAAVDVRPDTGPVDPDVGREPECGPGARFELCPRGVCAEGRCVEPATCERADHCLQDRVCVAGRCRDVCASHDDCDAGDECTDSLCGPPPAPECDGERPCPGRRTCHPLLNVCVEPADCLDDRDCDVTRWGPRGCEPVSRQCRYCVDDDDCAPHRACAEDPAARQPVCAEWVPCEHHADCLGDRRCDLRTGECVFDQPCGDDEREPNDNVEQAEQNDRSHLAPARYTGLAVCAGNDDVYRVRVPPGRGLVVVLRHLAAFDELDLAILDDTGAVVAAGEGTDNAERAALQGNLPEGGFFYVRVTSRRGGSNFYSLEVSVPPCVDDAAEEDDSAAAAVPVRDGRAGWLCGPDADWSVVDVPPGATLAVDLIHEAEGLGLIATADPREGGPVARGTPLPGGSALRVPTGEGGRFWLSVEGDAQVRAPWRLEASISAPADCADDAREDNDARLTPSRIVPGANLGMRACPGDPDWYSFPLEEGQGVEIRPVSARLGALAVTLYAPTAGAAPPALLARPDDDDVIRLGRAPVAGSYLLQVTSSVEASYRLDLYVFEDGFCRNDRYEDNDEVGAEQPIDPGEHDLVLCEDDKDRFSVDLDAGAIVDVALAYNPASGLGLALYDPSGRLVDESGDGGGAERVRARVLQTGRHVVRVGHLEEPVETPYLLTVYVEPVHDDCDNPLPIRSGEWDRSSTARARDDLRGLCGGVGPDVVYVLELEEPSGVEALLIPEPGAFPGALYLRTVCDEAGSEVACVRDGQGARRLLREPYLRGGTYYLVVDGTDRARGGNFDLNVRIVPGGICFPDDLEPSDDPAAAPPLAEGVWPDLRLCAGDDDWYRVAVPAGHDLSVRMQPADDASPMSFELRRVVDGGEVLEAGPVEGAGELLVAVEEPGDRLLHVAGGPGGYTLTVGLVRRDRPEDSCLGAPLLESGARVEGDTSLLHDFAHGACGNPDAAPSLSADAVYRVELAERSSVKATVRGPFDKVVYLRSVCENPAAEVLCVDDWLDPPEVLEHPHLDPGTYFLFVDGFGGDAGAYELALSVREPFFPPDNDTCERAEPLVPGEEVRGSTRLAADDYASTCTFRGGHAAPDVVYTFSLDGPARVVLTLEVLRDELDRGNFDSVLYLRADCEGDGQVIACEDEPEPQLIDRVLGAGDYFVFVDGWRAGMGEFLLRFDVLPPD